MRTETDILGEVQLDDSTAYGINTARAAANFPLHHRKTNLHLIYAIVTVKKAAALTYAALGVREKGIYEAIVSACDDVLAGNHDEAFVIEALQGGAGTSTNMNVNEVLANLALQKLGYAYGRYDIIHPLDDVNRDQSTNDVYPTALRIAAIQALRVLSDNCAALQTALQEKENAYERIPKLGRTELMDAVPITMGNEFGAYAQAIARDRWRLYKIEERLRQVNLGGTAVGVSNTASRQYRFRVIEELRRLTDMGLAAAEYPMDVTQNNDVFVEVSGLLKALAVNLMKIANDLRLMNSGPHGGFGEIKLAPLQQGSTIMPGKINPVIPEMTMQCAMKVMANDSAMTMAASHGDFELNAFFPLIADSLLESIQFLTASTDIFRTKCIALLQVDEDRCAELLAHSAAFGTAYIQQLGYDKVSEIIKNNSPAKAKEILDSLVK